MIPNIGILELSLILIVVIVIFGPGRLSGLGTALGKAVKGFRKEANDGLPAPNGGRMRSARDRVKRQSVSGSVAVSLGETPVAVDRAMVDDPARREIFATVFRVGRLILKLWRWRKHLP